MKDVEEIFQDAIAQELGLPPSSVTIISINPATGAVQYEIVVHANSASEANAAAEQVHSTLDSSTTLSNISASVAAAVQDAGDAIATAIPPNASFTGHAAGSITVEEGSAASQLYDLNQENANEAGLIEIIQDPGGTSMAITITRPITTFPPLDTNFDGSVELCASVPMEPNQLVRPGVAESAGEDDTTLARPDATVGAEEGILGRPGGINQQAVLARPVRSFRGREKKGDDGTHPQRSLNDKGRVAGRRRSFKDQPVLSKIWNGMSRMLQQPEQSSPPAIGTEDFCLSISLGDLPPTFDGGSLSPSVVPPSGLQVCRCTSENVCVDEFNPPDDTSTLRLCLIAPNGEPLEDEDVTFLQVDDPNGDTTIILPSTGDGGGATFEISPDGVGVLTFPIDEESLGPSGGTFTISGVAIVGDVEEFFTQDVVIGPGDPANPWPGLDLSYTKEAAMCNCVTTRPTPSLALAADPPLFPLCPDPDLISFPRTNQVTICIYSRMNIVDIRDFALRHQYGQSLPIITDGQVLDRSMTHVKIKGNSALVRMRLPVGFYDGVPQFPATAEGLALAILITDGEVVRNAPGGPPASVTNPNSGPRSLQGDTSAPSPVNGPSQDELDSTYTIPNVTSNGNANVSANRRTLKPTIFSALNCSYQQAQSTPISPALCPTIHPALCPTVHSAVFAPIQPTLSTAIKPTLA
ncbi:hypothetical protein ACHAXT_012126 [Thalassiosira profunda]